MHVYGPLVYGWCRRGGLSAESADDVGQHVFLAVHRSLKDFRHENFRGWLRTITQNKIRDFAKKRRNEPDGVGGSDGQRLVNAVTEADSLGELSNTDETKLLYRRVLDWIHGEFSEQDWEAFRGVVVDEKSAAEVAAELGITRNQVYLAKSRILRRVREAFQEIPQT